MELKIACVGVGHWGRNIVRNLSSLGILSHLYDISDQRREALREEYPDVTVAESLDGILRDDEIDGVAIATPADTHAEIVRAALEADKHVFVEKPLCLSLEEGRRLVEMAGKRDRTLMVGHLLWYHPAVLRLKELVEDGGLGRIQYIYSNRLNLGKIRRDENILWSFAPHDISVMLGLVGEMPSSVHATGANYLHSSIHDVTVSHLSFPSGVHGHIFVSWLHPFKEQRLVVVGDRKMAVFDDMKEKKLTVYPHTIDWEDGAPVPTRAEGQTVDCDATEPLRAELEHYLHCIRTGARPRTDGEEALRVLEVLHECQESLENEESGRTGAPRERDYFVHPSSYVESRVQIGRDTRIWHFSHVLKDTRIGASCTVGQNVMIGPDVTVGDEVKIQNNVSVYKGVTLEDRVFCGPSVVFTNVLNPRSEISRMDELEPTLVREGATLGANCTVVCGVEIGRYAFVGAGAVVTRDVPDHALVVGSPARITGWMCRCGNRIRFEDADEAPLGGACEDCGREYARSGDSVRALNDSEESPMAVEA